MKKILFPGLLLITQSLLAQITPVNSEYEKFVAREGSIILTKGETVFEEGGIESLEITLTEGQDVTRGETIKALAVSVNKSSVYLSRHEVETLVAQMKKIQLLLVDGEISKEHQISYNIRNSFYIDVEFSASKKNWKYNFGVMDDGRKKTKEVSSTEFQDIKVAIEELLSSL